MQQEESSVMMAQDKLICEFISRDQKGTAESFSVEELEEILDKIT